MATHVLRLRRRRASNIIHLDDIKEEETQETVAINDINVVEVEKEPPDQELIWKNSQPAIEHTRKLQRAHDVQQPRLMESKGPVHQRLGIVRVKRMRPSAPDRGQIIRRRPRGSGASVASVATNGRARRNFTLKRLGGPRYQMNTAQARMERVRAQLASNMNTGPIRLRRTPNRARFNSNNLTIQVDNFQPSTNGQTYPSNVVRFRLKLDPEIQFMIRQLQAGDISGQFYPIERVTPEVTPIFLSNRFSLLT